MKIPKIWWVLFLISLLVIVPFLFPYLTLDPANSRITIIPGTIHYPLLVAHIVAAFIALLTGFFQFVDRIRLKNPSIHRFLGRIYVYSVFINGLLSLASIFYAENFMKATSFLVLSFAWLFTCWKGYLTAINREFEEHRKWMIRSFGMTLVAISARLLVPVLLLLYYIFHGFSLPHGMETVIGEVLNVNIWAGLILNFVIVEWAILKK
ncbi:DUF2306 domain-containing protein [Brevibacillus porteri]|uniref:DUF2306 domain-containing protein n=1 Tax=Brevibacillus porteri TaxID=2126350 RepID=A0ABX5FID9_9BACL|nr:DUF2306 domain-containing protein [Brevibacillus porteri]MED1801267.1 DUF2306 domain-containing protein [Brevibacillus porteri]MED2129896.1 DUF2306 domain-containing protein [Brevibacillus porteri]MED2746825.1 DUF2306 domain-containing protein [Brevibacillus porteri]MED2815975.1 DUF2306 domain-containing protein [Brevibacillus porteri]MED2895792.1 DUF2306 domain-containing protein [Brevibacillus porteri]